MLQNNRWVFLIISTITIVVMLGYLILSRSKAIMLVSSVAMILSGGIGNMIDRLALGYVVDMIEVRLINFAIFNVADCFVCVGAFLLFFAILLEKNEPTEIGEETTAEVTEETAEEEMDADKESDATAKAVITEKENDDI